MLAVCDSTASDDADLDDFVDNIDMLKGEFVLVVEGNKNIINYSELDIIEHVNLYISDGLSEMDSIKKVARDRNVPLLGC